MWTVKKLNFDCQAAEKERLLKLNELEELMNEAYNNARNFEKRV